MGEGSIRCAVEVDASLDLPLAVLEMDLVEALSEPYQARLRVQLGDPEADASLMLGRSCVLTVEREAGVTKRLCGVVHDVELGEYHPDELPVVTLTAGPALGLLQLVRGSRIFQELTVPEILEKVLAEGLGPYDREVRLELEATYAAREYCVQYQETLLGFASRLMEEEGIHYAFEHDGEVEVLVLRDRNTGYPETPTHSGTATIRYAPELRARVDDEVVVETRRVVRDVTTSVVTADWDWTRASMPFSGETRGTDAAGRDRESYEHGLGRSTQLAAYAKPAYGSDDAAAQAALRLEALRADSRTIEGASNVVGMAPGTRFELAGHPTDDGQYLVTSTRHENRGFSEQPSERYQNRFVAIPADTPHRPRRLRRKPSISLQTAVVTGPAGQEIHVDEHGRIKVQFHWDREGAGDDTSSCWVRVQQQPWSGAGWGFWFVPRIGMEVVVHFVDGDPDRPLVTGTVYNGANALPYPMPDEATKSTIRTDSSLGHSGYNELRFEDKAGDEQIFVHAQKDYNEVVENDHDTLVHGNQTIEVDGNQTQTVHKNQVEQVDANQDLSVGGDRTVHVKGDFVETVDGTETRQVDGAVSETFDANEDRAVAGNLDESIGASETRTVEGNLEETISGSQTRTVAAASSLTVAGALTQTVTGGITTNTPAAHTIIAVGGYSVTTPGKITLTAPAGAKFIAPGGFKQMDFFQEWMGGFYKELKTLDRCAFVEQLEAVGIGLEYVGVKIEVGGTLSSNEKIDKETVAGWIGSAGTALARRLNIKNNGGTVQS